MSKQVTIEEMKEIALATGGSFEHDSPYMPVIAYDEDDCGIEATEGPETGYDGYCAFRFMGLAANQALPHVMQAWSLLTNPDVEKPLLTVELAKTLIGKKLITSYCDTNEGGESFEIVGLEVRKEVSIGQSQNYILQTRPIDVDGNPLPVNGQAAYKLNGKIIQPNNRWYIIDGVAREVPGAAKIGGTEGVKKTFRTENVINMWQAKTGDCTGLEVITTDYETWCYEWQGIFRRGSGAERLFIEKIL